MDYCREEMAGFIQLLKMDEVVVSIGFDQNGAVQIIIDAIGHSATREWILT